MRDRDQKLVFLHIPKSAGLTFDAMLRSQFSPEDVCPERISQLAYWPREQLDSYLYFSGHETFRNLQRIPGEKKIVTFLRQPVDRIVSFYSYLSSHSWSAINGGNLHPHRLAKFYSLKDFLKNDPPGYLSSDNLMTRYLADLTLNRDGKPWRDDVELLETALENLETLTAVGLCEYFEDSLPHIFARLEMPAPASYDTKNVTYTNHVQAPGWFEPMESFEIDDETDELLAQFSRLDQLVYREGRNRVLADIGAQPRRMRGFAHLVGSPLPRGADGARQTRIGEAGFLLHGPYMRLARGDYRLSLRLEAGAVEPQGADGEVMAVVDVVSSGGSRVHTLRQLTHGDLLGGDANPLQIEFRLPNTVGDLEVRVCSTGRCELTLDLDIRLQTGKAQPAARQFSAV